jgi:hypothetical protein
MAMRSILWLLLSALLVIGCSFLTGPPPTPVPTELEPGARILVFQVTNNSDEDATLRVGMDNNFPANLPVGAVEPNIVPPHSSMPVVFHVPPTGAVGSGWAIFVNTRPDKGPMFIESELKNCVGAVPVEIVINEPLFPEFHRQGPSCIE